MLCPLPNTNGNAKSRSAWLDRLHTRNQNQNQNQNQIEAQTQTQSASPSSSPSPTPTPTPTPSPSMGDVMSSILADLFVMGNGNQSQSHPSLRLQSSKARGLRKQPSPKICIVSPTSAAPTSPTSPHLNLKKMKMKMKKKKLKTKTNPLTLPVSNFKTQNKNQKNNKKRKRLSQPHGRTEATVIDTSTPSWKSPKILIRKGPTFWKILDKKQWNAALTKRKQKHLLHSHKSSHPSHQGDNLEESIDVMQGPVKRPKCSKLPSIPEAAKSIALHLKVRTKGKKKGPSYSSSPKENVQP